eukprot:TRINITY_DN67429_c8_g1_i2.p1 TRINITY_DN67429_c8_g1~~TRINITY_DN67429_c8_g1_i2.p1  ORF type:complete len:290 (-),score=19.84 TRINITY_DN67429_c8_g1_i2:29-802(-)
MADKFRYSTLQDLAASKAVMLQEIPMHGVWNTLKGEYRSMLYLPVVTDFLEFYCRSPTTLQRGRMVVTIVTIVTTLLHLYGLVIPVLLAITLKEWSSLQLMTGIGGVVCLTVGMGVLTFRWSLKALLGGAEMCEAETLPTAVEFVNEYYSKNAATGALPVLLKRGLPLDVCVEVTSFLVNEDVLIGSPTEKLLLTNKLVQLDLLPFHLFFPSPHKISGNLVLPQFVTRVATMWQPSTALWFERACALHGAGGCATHY